jgi:ribosomal-protein-alanine N-acetyltransferase
MFAPINGKRINLRALRSSDEDGLCMHAKEREISRFTFIPHPYRPDHARRFLEYSRMQQRKEIGLHLGIEEKSSGQIIGVIGFEGIDRHNRKVEIGYWLGKRYWHQGFATEAVTLALKYAFATLRMKRVYAHVFPGNETSERLLLGLGFTREGVERASRVRRGRWMDCILYAILKEDFRKRRISRERSNSVQKSEK